MINLGEWGTIAGSITAIVSLILLVIRPVTASFSKITETLSKVSHNLDLLTKDLESSKSDRLMIHEELKKHDERLDTHADTPVITPKNVATALIVSTVISVPFHPQAFPSVATNTEAAGNTVKTAHLMT